MSRPAVTTLAPAPLKYALIQGLLSPFFAAERLRSGLTFNFLAAGFRANPYPFYARLRAREPLHRSPLMDGYVVTRYDDVAALLKDDERFSSNPRSVRRIQRIEKVLATLRIGQGGDQLAQTMQRADPPEHSRLRRLTAKAFTPRRVEALRSSIETLADELLNKAAPARQMDVIRDLAHPLPVRVIADMVGISAEDHERFKRWSDLAINRRSPQAMQELRGFLTGLVKQREQEPREDILSALLAVEDGGERLTQDEVFATCGLLLLAGHETTTHLIGNGLFALLTNPEQLQALREEPGLIDSAVEELLRYDSPVQMVTRAAKVDVELRGQRIQAGQTVMLALGAANRDPERFVDPDRLELSRKDNQPLSFGKGIHFCLGAHLARMEARIVLSELLRRFPELQLATDRVRVQDDLVIRGLEALPVRF